MRFGWVIRCRWRIALAGALICALACCGCFFVFHTTLEQAFASESASLEVGADIFYGGYSTNWLSVEGSMAYCAHPEKQTPPAGSYEKQEIVATNGRTDEVRADLWFGFGGPGFDASWWPTTWYDGSAMTDERYAALTHIIVAEAYNDSAIAALKGTSQQFRTWARAEVLGYDEEGLVSNEQATARIIAAHLHDVPSAFTTFALHTGSSTQDIVSFAPVGSLELHKISSHESVSAGNPCYSLEGATYEVRAASGEVVGTLTTDADGYAHLEGLLAGSYTVKETTPSKGMALDRSEYSVEVVSGSTTLVNGSTVSDTPQMNPIEIALRKVDSSMGAGLSQGAATLAHARFSFQYYAGFFDTADAARASGVPLRSWVFETDSEGVCRYRTDDQVEGDALYTDENGTEALPLGTVVIEEVKAPLGYVLPSEAQRTFCVQITSDGVDSHVSSFAAPACPEQPIRGDFRLIKEAPTALSDNPQEQQRVLVEGVLFQVINDNEQPVISPETGALCQTGEVVCTIKTDESGQASTRASETNGWATPAGWTGALPFGTYRIHEVIPNQTADRFKAKYGKTLLTVPDWKVSIQSDGAWDPPTLVLDRIPQTPLRIEKVDAESGKRIPLPCTFSLYKEDGRVVEYIDRTTGQSKSEWTTNDAGEIQLPMLLEEGIYELHEIQAPEGYLINKEPIRFDLQGFRDWDNPLTVTCVDNQPRARLRVVKTDSDTGQVVAGATYRLKAQKDIVSADGTIHANAGDEIGQMATDSQGVAIFDGLRLGSYAVEEVAPAAGYARDTAIKTVELAYAGQETALVETDCPVTDSRTRVIVRKVSAKDTDKGLPQARFSVTKLDSGTVTEIETDESGNASLDGLSPGVYRVKEEAAPHGYALDTEQERTFTVDNQGFVHLDEAAAHSSETTSVEHAPVAQLTLTFSNEPIELASDASDQESGSHEGQARAEASIIDAVSYSGLEAGKNYRLVGTLMDCETGEVLSINGMPITAETTFSAQHSSGSVETVFSFDASGLAGKSVVAYETCFLGDSVVAMHEDIADTRQMVHFIDISTAARDGGSDGSGTRSVIDAVSYRGLEPGKTYRMIASLVDADSAAPLTARDGLPATGEASFTPDAPDGSVDVTLSIREQEVSGKRAVVFERLVDEKGHVIATHEDIQSAEQTVSFVDKPGFSLPKTGDYLIGILCVLSLAIGASLVLFVVRRRGIH